MPLTCKERVRIYLTRGTVSVQLIQSSLHCFVLKIVPKEALWSTGMAAHPGHLVVV